MGILELLQRAHEQADGATPLVRAAARLRIARVEAATDHARGRITLDKALEDVATLAEPERTMLFDHARVFAAAVEPSLLPGIPHDSLWPPGYDGWVLGTTMLDHGHAEAALRFVLEGRDASAFPFSFAMRLLHECVDQGQRLTVMRTAAKAWEQTKERDFITLFEKHWTLLPVAEAFTMVRSVVHSTLGEPDWPMTVSLDEGRLRFTSGREYTLFQVLHILRRLDPQLTDQLLATHEQLAAAARRYPDGWYSIQEEDEKEQGRRTREGTAVGGREYVRGGVSRELGFQFALNEGDFHSAMDFAQTLYQEDMDAERPNFAPKVLWPSAARFRSVLFQAGKRGSLNPQELLARVPDDDLRLLASIELAAALAGLPEPHTSSRRLDQSQHGWLRNMKRSGHEADPQP